VSARSPRAGSRPPTCRLLPSVPLPTGHPVGWASHSSGLWARFQGSVPPPRDREEVSAAQSMPPGSSLRALRGVRHLILRSQLASPNGNPINRSFPRKQEPTLQTFRKALPADWIPFFARITCDWQQFSWQMSPLPSSNYGNDRAHPQARKNLTRELAIRIVKLSGGIRNIHCK